MDVGSIEFYTVAFIVAMALVGYFMSRGEKPHASTRVVQLETAPALVENDEDILHVQWSQREGTMVLSRCGLRLGEGETANLVVTVAGDRCTIVEKKGRGMRRVSRHAVTGTVTVPWDVDPTVERLHVRYDSQLTSRWAAFVLDVTQDTIDEVVTLRY